MTENELAVAAFTKMTRGEPVSLSDAQRVAQVWISNGMNIDTGNKGGLSQFYGEVQKGLYQRFFNNQAQMPAPAPPAPEAE